MTYLVSTSVHTSMPCSKAEHPILHDVIDYIEDASKTTYDFVKSKFNYDTGISVDCPQSESKVTLAQIRAEIDSIDHQLHISNLHIEILRQALDLSRDARVTLKARHAELVNSANEMAERTGHVTLLPQELISHIASFLYWEVEVFEMFEPGLREPHFEWVEAVYRPASEPVHFRTGVDSQLRLTSGNSAAVTDDTRPLSVHFNEMASDVFFEWNIHGSVRFPLDTLLPTTHRWQELTLFINNPAEHCNILNCVTELPNLAQLSLYYGINRSDLSESAPLPEWWGGFVERFGRAGSMCPNLRSAILPLRCLTTSGDLVSNVLHLEVDLSKDQVISELSSAFCNMHHLITLKILFGCSDGAENSKKRIIILPYLKELTICGIKMGVSSLTPTVGAFECENLQAFGAELFPLGSQPEPEEMAELLISVNDSFPMLEQLDWHIPNHAWVPCDRDIDTDTELLPMVSHSVIQNLSFGTKDGRWLLTHLTTLSLPFESDTATLRDLVALSRNRRTKEDSARLLYLKFVGGCWNNKQESEDMRQSLLMHYHDVEISDKQRWG